MHLDRLRGLIGADIDDEWQVELTGVELELALWEGDLSRAIERARFGMDTTFEGRACCDTPGPTSLPMNAMAAAVRMASPDDAAAFAAIFRSWVEEKRWGGGPPAELATVSRQIEAELAVAEGRGDPDDWSELARDWLECGLLPRAAYARWREAELRIASGDRVGATDAALEAYETAAAVGWAWVRESVLDLARRARLDIVAEDRPAPGPADELGLTGREVEVLRLVAEGRTNRQIAETLFISPKTASAHVSNLLMKLAVTNRAEAGAAARRLSLD